MNKWKYSLVSQFVSNVDLIIACHRDTLLDASSHDHTCRVHSTKQVSNPIRVHMHPGKSSCINSMGSSFLGPVIPQQTLVNSALPPNVLALDPTLLRYHVCRVSAPCDSCIELCTAVLNCDQATHSLPADRTPVYRECPNRDPRGCPLIPKQDGIRGKAPTLWLLQLLRLLQLLHECACDQHWTRFHKQTAKRKRSKKKSLVQSAFPWSRNGPSKTNRPNPPSGLDLRCRRTKGRLVLLHVYLHQETPAFFSSPDPSPLALV